MDLSKEGIQLFLQSSRRINSPRERRKILEEFFPEIYGAGARFPLDGYGDETMNRIYDSILTTAFEQQRKAS